MPSRRDFLLTVAAASALGGVRLLAKDSPPAPLAVAGDRKLWVWVLDKLAHPVLTRLAAGRLKAEMPVEAVQNPQERARFTHLEAFGRLLSGIAPWLALEEVPPEEAALQSEYIALAQQALAKATDPASPDFLNFHSGDQPLVDAAFLVQGILRAPNVLWEPLSPQVKAQVIAALKSSRQIAMPTRNNWVLFAGMVEIGLRRMGEPSLKERLEDGVQKMLGWYAGDGAYGDGATFHFDYYNSFVIHPMLLDILEGLNAADPGFQPALALEKERARRYAAIQERLIMPDGSFPSIGRSTAYRFGAFHLLAQSALRKDLPHGVEPSQVRSGLAAVMARVTAAPGTFDGEGWLRIGFCGHQPELAEAYISTGSLYLASEALLPLGLPASAPFWADPDRPWTQRRIWAGERLAADHAITDAPVPRIPALPQR